eukprot:274715_1
MVDPLPFGIWGTRAIFIEKADSIFVTANSEMYRIDCEQGTVGFVSYIYFDAKFSGFIFFEHVLYLFVGRNGSTTVKTWQQITNPDVFGNPYNINSSTISTTDVYQSTYESTTIQPSAVHESTVIQSTNMMQSTEAYESTVIQPTDHYVSTTMQSSDVYQSTVRQSSDV